MAEFVDDCATIFGVAIARRKVIDTQAWWLAGGASFHLPAGLCERLDINPIVGVAIAKKGGLKRPPVDITTLSRSQLSRKSSFYWWRIERAGTP